MNRKLGQLIKAAIFTLPLALPGMAFAQSAGGSIDTKTNDTAAPPAQEENKGAIDESNKGVNSPQPGADEMNANPQTGSKSDLERNPPAGSLDNSGSSKTKEPGVGGDINKSPDTNMDNDTTKSKEKKSTYPSTPGEPSPDNSKDMNR